MSSTSDAESGLEAAAAQGARDDAHRILMVEYQRGSLVAFHALYADLSPGLLRYLRYLTRGSDNAEDLMQETFLQMHRSRAAYNPSYAVRPWAFSLARNVFLMNGRAARRWAAVHDTRVSPPDVPVPAEVESLGSAEEVRRSIASLSVDRAEAILLHHEWGFTFEEIAGMLGISAATARARASRGIAELRDALSGRGIRR